MNKGLKVLEKLVDSSKDPMAKKILRVGLRGLSATELKEEIAYLDKEIEKETRRIKVQEIIIKGEWSGGANIRKDEGRVA